MGCDIHLYREVKVNGKWTSADHWESYDYGADDRGAHIPYNKRAYSGRNYNLFGLLCKDVRREFAFSFEPRGNPLQSSPEVAREVEQWDRDGHNHSYLYLHELVELREFLNSATIPVYGMKEKNELDALTASINSDSPNWDLLYPYCQYTNAPNHVEFSVDVPAIFIIGPCLDTIISSFDGIEGETPRIVFFFDN